MGTTTRFLGLGIGTAVTAGALVVALAGCGLADSGITVVGANPGSVSVPISVVAQGVSTARARSDAPAAAVVATADASPVGLSGHGGGVCTTADLRLTVTWAVSGEAAVGGAGGKRQQVLTLVYTNTSTSPCVLRGYPNVDFLRAGVRGPLSEPDTFAVTQRITSVELAPGGSAHATATFITSGPANASGSRCEDVVAVRTFPPGSAVAVTSSIHGMHGAALRHFHVCGHGVVVSALQP